MAKKKQRSDAERRARQCERLSRLLRVLRLVLGPGRWDADGLARELECSTRTVHRLLQALSMAGVPWFYDNALNCYRVRPGFRFPVIDRSSDAKPKNYLEALAKESLTVAHRLLEDVRHLVEAITKLQEAFDDSKPAEHSR